MGEGAGLGPGDGRGRGRGIGRASACARRCVIPRSTVEPSSLKPKGAMHIPPPRHRLPTTRRAQQDTRVSAVRQGMYSVQLPSCAPGRTSRPSSRSCSAQRRLQCDTNHVSTRALRLAMAGGSGLMSHDIICRALLSWAAGFRILCSSSACARDGTAGGLVHWLPPAYEYRGRVPRPGSEQ